MNSISVVNKWRNSLINLFLDIDNTLNKDVISIIVNYIPIPLDKLIDSFQNDLINHFNATNHIENLANNSKTSSFDGVYL